MLNEILQAVASANGPLSLGSLSKQLGAEPSALEGMILYWVRKGRLRIEGVNAQTATACDSGHCGLSCPGPTNCPFSIQLPDMMSLSVIDEESGDTGQKLIQPAAPFNK